MIFNCARAYVSFSLGVILTLTIHIILDYNYCVTNFSTHKIIHTNYTRNITILDIVNCSDVNLEKQVEQRGAFMVLRNYIKASKRFKCAESITLTAPGDYRFLDNVVPLVDRWKGPISIALYAPGQDFFTTLQSIAYLRTCTTSLVRELVTFHLFFEYDHMPLKNGSSLLTLYKDTFDCSLKPPYEIMKSADMYKAKHNLSYPINVARNVARLCAQTHFVFPSDIELYPTTNFIPKFFDFILKYPKYGEKNSRNVFVIPIFEVVEGQKIPENKTELKTMVDKKEAIIFHQNLCRPCHKIPRNNDWLKANETQGLNVFHAAKRHGDQKIWEPFFVSTQNEPLWDERLDWEGQGNKMSQAYTLCILDYDFLVLDNAFLIHKPGVKKKKVQVQKHLEEVKRNNKLLLQIQDEIQRVYNKNDKCKIHNV